ncbi:hypothetical protein TanjilG_18165 [Lupinus angustifolius]|uniref:F-box protein At3g26010-like beta-propeller domain-containing protein n=1 Tax=Lupinus angustifolius TaxID=3871 RepID=A0A1J7FNT3_LUPAN|nr:hypothetical protein TanjilG_18165 [Lupinus angustifolius]
MNEVALFVSNPVTRSLLHIPIMEQVRKNVNADLKIVFECDSNGFIVFIFHTLDWSPFFDCQVLSSEEGVWKSKETRFFTGPRDLRFDMPVCFNGAIHLISTCSPYEDMSMPYIVSYNYENGMSRMLSVPKEARRGFHHVSCDMAIFKWGKVTNSTESICLVRLLKSAFTVWVLTDYESNSWRRIMKAKVIAMVGSREQNPVVTGYIVLNDECLVFTTENKVYSYNWTQMEIMEIGEHKCESSKISIISYSNTLRPCGILSSPSYNVNAISLDEESTPSNSEVLPSSLQVVP